MFFCISGFGTDSVGDNLLHPVSETQLRAVMVATPSVCGMAILGDNPLNPFAKSVDSAVFMLQSAPHDYIIIYHVSRITYHESMSTPVSTALHILGIPHRTFTHTGSVTSLEQAAAERGQIPQQVVRSILFRLGQDQYALALIAGPDQLSWKALRRHFGQSRLTMASADEVLSVTGYVIGAVSPFGMPAPLPVLIDESVPAQDEVSIGSGERGTTVILRSADLLRALPEAVVGQFREVAAESQ